MSKDIITIEQLKTHFPVKKGIFSQIKGYNKAVDDVSFSIKKGESFGLVGESGSGKTTLARSLIYLVSFTSGNVRFKGEQINYHNKKELISLRRKIQIVFQDPFSSLNPRKSIGSLLIEPLLVHKLVKKKDALSIVIKTLKNVGLKEDDFYKYPHEFSGGQRQRVGIARALIMNPEVIILDEPVSSLDVSIQAQILNLLKELQAKYNLTYLFIAHNLDVVRYFCDRVAVMYLGKIMELTDSETLFKKPYHPYTQLLLNSIPRIDVKKSNRFMKLKDQEPSLNRDDNICVFFDRCGLKKDICKQKNPSIRESGKVHFVRCNLK